MTNTLDPKYMVASSLQELFRDQSTGLPLRSGKIYFWQDINRTNPKTVYQLTGTPGSYTYSALPNPLPLTGIGSMSDGGNPANDIVIYYYPYDQFGNIDLYYVQVFNNFMTPQFSRQAWPPNVIDNISNVEDTVNYIPNGQFLAHNNIPEDVLNGYAEGEIREPITIVAPGGWQFSRPIGSAAKDIVTFQRIGSYVTNPTASPRYAFRLQTQSVGSGDSYKYLQSIFDDVNKFASDDQYFTVAFSGISNTASAINVSLVLIKNYGTGGSTQTQTTLATFTLGTSYSLFQVQFLAGGNSGKTIGPDDDDYTALCLAYQTNTVQDISVSDFMCCPNAVTIDSFPTTTNADFLVRSFSIQTNNHDGFDLGLPIVKTLKGYDVDSSVVGRIESSTQSSMDYRFLCDGSQYLTYSYQSNGIPNERLKLKLWNSTEKVPIYGTGLTFSTAKVDSAANPTVIRLHTNTQGVGTTTSDGSVPTGFDFLNMAIGDDTYGVYSPIGEGSFLIWNKLIGTATAPTANTSGFTFNVLKIGSSKVAQVIQFLTIGATTLSGKYFKFSTTTTNFYVWFTVSGSGSDPTPGGTGIKVSLLTGDTAQTVAQKISNVLNGYECDYITVNKTGATLTAGSFLTFNTLGGVITNWYVWYSINGLGVDPAPSNKTGINVNILTADTEIIICEKTVTAINSYYYAVPDFRGQTLRGLDIVNNYDSGPRYSFVDGIYGYNLGTYELDQLLDHYHSYAIINLGSGGIQTGSGASFGVAPTSQTGSQENRIYNSAINFFIHY